MASIDKLADVTFHVIMLGYFLSLTGRTAAGGAIRVRSRMATSLTRAMTD